MLILTTSQLSAGASRSSGNSAICRDRDLPSTTSIERHHAARWLSLISPRFENMALNHPAAADPDVLHHSSSSSAPCRP